MRRVRLLILLLPFLISNSANSQDSTGHPDISQIPSKYFDAVSKKANTLQEKLDNKSQKVLDRMQKQEAKLQKKLAKIDSLATHNIFSNSANKYNQLKEKLKSTGKLSQYIPKLDTLATSFKFLDQHPEFLNNVKDAKEKLADASEKLNDFKDKLKNAEDIKQFLKERKQYLKEQLEKFGFAKELKKINKEVYYYSQQIKEYKEIFKDPVKAERKAIELLSKTKLFQDFMKKNSFLAGLFRIPEDPNDPRYLANLTGLQTRAQVNQLVQNQITATGLNSNQQLTQNLQKAKLELQKLKDKINQLGGGSSDEELPDFKPNNQKTKSFFERLELGTNIQNKQSNAILPATTDLGLSIGYKINDKSIIGIGGSYKVGWGNGWNNIAISSQGASLRSFIDWKVKGSFYISGGFEMNYRSDLNNMSIVTRSGILHANAWQQSGLVGISKILSVKSKFFKKTKIQFLWDYLSYQQIPKAQPVVFRIGYNF